MSSTIHQKPIVKSIHQPVSPTDGFPYQFRRANEVISVWLAGLNTALRIWEMM